MAKANMIKEITEKYLWDDTKGLYLTKWSYVKIQYKLK